GLKFLSCNQSRFGGCIEPFSAINNCKIRALDAGHYRQEQTNKSQPLRPERRPSIKYFFVWQCNFNPCSNKTHRSFADKRCNSRKESKLQICRWGLPRHLETELNCQIKIVYRQGDLYCTTKTDHPIWPPRRRALVVRSQSRCSG